MNSIYFFNESCAYCKSSIKGKDKIKIPLPNNRYTEVCGIQCAENYLKLKQCQTCHFDNFLKVLEDGKAYCSSCANAFHKKKSGWQKTSIEIMKKAHQMPANMCGICEDEFDNPTDIFKKMGILLCESCDDIYEEL